MSKIIFFGMIHNKYVYTNTNLTNNCITIFFSQFQYYLPWDYFNSYIEQNLLRIADKINFKMRKAKKLKQIHFTMITDF